jgi:hypothetical protein
MYAAFIVYKTVTVDPGGGVGEGGDYETYHFKATKRLV